MFDLNHLPVQEKSQPGHIFDGIDRHGCPGDPIDGPAETIPLFEGGRLELFPKGLSSNFPAVAFPVDQDLHIGDPVLVNDESCGNRLYFTDLLENPDAPFAPLPVLDLQNRVTAFHDLVHLGAQTPGDPEGLSLGRLAGKCLADEIGRFLIDLVGDDQDGE